jgi:YesN/AraC family two-component response regulator
MYKVVLVEDEKWVRTALRKMIEKVDLPFEVIEEFSNGVEALQWLKTHQVDLILSDIRMPVMNGLELLKQLKDSQVQADVILVTGHDDFNYAQTALRQRAFDYLLKPVEAEHLKSTLENWLTTLKKEEPEHSWEELSPVEKVLSFLESKPGTDLALTDAAAMVHLNSSYFCKLFKQQTGVNYRDYITESRIREAVRMLEHTSLRISEIADRLGYAELAYFSNMFKKMTGQAPSEFRKQVNQVK